MPNLNTIQALANTSREGLTIYESYWEDSDGNIFYFYNGKNTVLGLAHPDYILDNDDKHLFARIAFYKYNEIGDDSIFVYMNETLDVTTITPVSDSTKFNKAKSFKVHFEAVGKAGRVDKSTVRCTITNSNAINYKTATEKEYPKVFVTEDSYLDSDSNTKYGVGLWIDISDMDFLLINVDKSLAANSVPINSDHFPTSYEAKYLNNVTKEIDVNLINVEDLLEDRLIMEAVDYNANNVDRIEELEKKNKFEPHQYHQNTVQYNPTYEPTSAGVEEIVQGTTIIAPVLDRILTLDLVKKTFTVKQDGIYALQLKNGFYLIQGESRLDLKVYIGTNQIKEMSLSAYLTSNNEEDQRKAIKNTYSSQVYIVPLTTTDEIKLTATWANIEDIVMENETMITCTALQYNVI